MKPRKSYITLIRIFIKVGFGIILSLFVGIVYSDKVQINPSFRLLGLCNFLVGGILFGGLRLFFGPVYIEIITVQNSGKLFSSLETDFGESGEDLIAGLIMISCNCGYCNHVSK